MTVVERRHLVNSELAIEVACERIQTAYTKAVAHWDLYSMAHLGPQLTVLQRIIRETKERKAA